MNPEHTNLLPDERIRLLRQEYLVRLVTVGVALATLLVAITSVLLIPTFLYLTNQIKERTAQLTSLEARLQSSGALTLESRLLALSRNANTLKNAEHVATASLLMNQVLAVPHASIALTAFTLTKESSPGVASIVITGVAATRDALHAYQLALLHTPNVKNADLPISAYAHDTDIHFTITVTLGTTL